LAVFVQAYSSEVPLVFVKHSKVKIKNIDLYSGSLCTYTSNALSSLVRATRPLKTTAHSQHTQVPCGGPTTGTGST